MNRTAAIASLLVLSAAGAHADTFNARPYVAEAGIDVLSRRVANEQFGRDLLGTPYAAAVVGRVDVYDRFPYLEARYFQIVSDPSWNRLLMGEAGKSLAAFDGSGTAAGALKSPRGLCADERGRVYVADSGNDRVLVFETSTEYDRIEMRLLFAIDDLNDPYAVAYSDGGSAFGGNDDCLYVANTGRNEVRRYALGNNRATLTASIGELGSGPNRFAGPTAIAVSRTQGQNGTRVYVADSHNRRIVQIDDKAGALSWSGEAPHTMGVVTSLDTDHHGNLYAAAPNAGRVAKFTAALAPLANLTRDVERPRAFHAVFATVTDHRTGARSHAGQGTGIVVESWNERGGMRLVNLGVDLTDARAASDGSAAATVTLTDHAAVSAELIDPQSGLVVARRDLGVLAAGSQTIRLNSADAVASYPAGDYQLALHARSTYDGSSLAETTVPVSLAQGGTPALSNRLVLAGNAPNPFNPVTTIRFSVPVGPERAYRLDVYDVAGRLVRVLGEGRIASGWHDVRWDGRDGRGAPASSGVYLYRLSVANEQLTGKMVLLK